jgi:hypothetical protein
LKTDHPQRTLYRLTGWAEEQHVELEGLEVTRPTLDDVFLELTGAHLEGDDDRHDHHEHHDQHDPDDHEDRRHETALAGEARS